MSLSTCRSVGESSTIRMRLMVMVLRPLLPPRWRPGSRGARVGSTRLVRGGLHMRGHRLQQAFLGERLGQILVGADHAPASAIEQAVLGRKHDDRRLMELGVFLDQG